jgi:putative ATP-binding cassette transporter
MSLGEQQRLAMARAILAEPDILFLDEATSAVDPDTEAALYGALQSRLAKTTIVSVAHRPSLKAFHSSFLHVRPGPELSERLHEADAKRA